MENNNLVFLHGAGLSSYIWSDIKSLIEAEALFIDFPNRGVTENINKNLNYQDYLNHAIDQIKTWSTNKFILVTHSISGIIGLNIAEHFEERITGFIGISSAIPEKKSSFISCLPFPQKLIMPTILNLFGTKPPNKSILHELCNDLSELQSDRVIRSFTPESKSLYTTNINYKDLKSKTLYVKLLNDKSFPVAIQDRMIHNLKPEKVIDLQSGHLPMMSQPKKLAEIINSFIKAT